MARLGRTELAASWEYTVGAAHGGHECKGMTRSNLCFRKNSHPKAECWREKLRCSVDHFEKI